MMVRDELRCVGLDPEMSPWHLADWVGRLLKKPLEALPNVIEVEVHEAGRTPREKPVAEASVTYRLEDEADGVAVKQAMSRLLNETRIQTAFVGLAQLGPQESVSSAQDRLDEIVEGEDRGERAGPEAGTEEESEAS